MKKTGKFPKAWEKVCTIANLFPSNKYLYDTYNLTEEDIIIVRHTKTSKSKYHWVGYRTAFKHVFNGTVKDFDKFCLEWYQKNVWKKKKLN